jgi:hypothetical protein
MKWFKMFGEARNDAKLRTLSDEQFRVWFGLLCFASEQPTGGTIVGYDDVLLAIEVAGGDTELLQSTLQKLQALRIVTVVTSVTPQCNDECHDITFVSFAERQAKPTEDKEAVRERVRKFRAAKSAEKPEFESESPSETPSGNDVTTVTPLPVTKCNGEREEGEDLSSPTRRAREANTPSQNPPPAAEKLKPDQRPYIEGEVDARFQSAHFLAMCRACARGPTGISFAMKCKLSVAAVTLEGEGYTPAQIEEAGRLWPMPMPPRPEQLQDDIKAILNRKEVNQRGSHSGNHRGNGRSAAANARGLGNVGDFAPGVRSRRETNGA